MNDFSYKNEALLRSLKRNMLEAHVVTKMCFPSKFPSLLIISDQGHQVRLLQVRSLRHHRETGRLLRPPSKHRQREDLRRPLGLVHRAGGHQHRLLRHHRLEPLHRLQKDQAHSSELKMLVIGLQRAEVNQHYGRMNCPSDMAVVEMKWLP